MILKFRKKNKAIPRKRIDIKKITKNQDVRIQVARETTKARKPEEVNVRTEKSQQKWKNARKEVQKKVIGTLQREKKKACMTEEILRLSPNESTQNKQTEDSPHKLNRWEIRNLKEKQLSEKCEEIEKMQEQHYPFNRHKMIKEMTGNRRAQTSGEFQVYCRKYLTGYQRQVGQMERKCRTAIRR